MLKAFIIGASHPTESSFSPIDRSPQLTAPSRGAGQPLRAQTSAARVPTDALRRLVLEASRRHGVDPAWVLALIEVESGFDAKAISPKGAIGLMQVMPETAKQYGLARPADLCHPDVNVSIGVRHLRKLLDRHHNNWPVVLAAYNAGENAVAKRGQRIPAFRETLLYVPAVLSRVQAHQQRLDAANLQ